MLFVVAIASFLNAKRPTVFVKNLLNKSFVRNASSVTPKIPNAIYVKVLNTDCNTAYTLFEDKITRTRRFFDVHTLKDLYINSEVAKGSEEYEKIKGKFLYTDEGRKILAFRDGALFPKDVFPE